MPRTKKSRPTPTPAMHSGVAARAAKIDVYLSGDALMGAYDRLAERVDVALGTPDDDRARILVDGVLLKYVTGLDADEVLRIARQGDSFSQFEAAIRGLCLATAAEVAL